MSGQMFYEFVDQIIPSKSDNSYTSCYCEENVWKLCDKVKNGNKALLEKCHVVFISNPNKSVALWNQKAGTNPDNLVIWDYHVIFITACPKEGCKVYDLDSSLPFPCDFETYSKKTFHAPFEINEEFQCYFRVVKAANYLDEFSSDRRHMRDANNSWLSPPPSWPLIQAKGISHNLDKYNNMKLGDGNVLNLAGFLKKIKSLSN